jgi:hypothetical protein
MDNIHDGWSNHGHESWARFETNRWMYTLLSGRARPARAILCLYTYMAPCINQGNNMSEMYNFTGKRSCFKLWVWVQDPSLLYDPKLKFFKDSFLGSISWYFMVHWVRITTVCGFTRGRGYPWPEWDCSIACKPALDKHGVDRIDRTDDPKMCCPNSQISSYTLRTSSWVAVGRLGDCCMLLLLLLLSITD